MKEEKRDDLRVRRTRLHLWNALMGLLSRRPMEELSVQEICEAAMVHRTTFYKHFEDKYDLLESGMAGMYRRLADSLRSPRDVLTDEDPLSGGANLTNLFRHVQEERDFYLVALKRKTNAHLRGRIENFILETITDRLDDLHRQVTTDPAVSMDFLAAFSAGAIMGSLMWWAERGFEGAPEEMGRDVSRLISRGQFPLFQIDATSEDVRDHYS